MNGENSTSWVQDFRKITHHFRGIYEICLKLIVYTFTCCNYVSIFRVFSRIVSPLRNWSEASTKLSLFRTWSAMAARVIHLYLWLSLSLPLFDLQHNCNNHCRVSKGERGRIFEFERTSQSFNMNALNQFAVQMFILNINDNKITKLIWHRNKLQRAGIRLINVTSMNHPQTYGGSSFYVGWMRGTFASNNFFLGAFMWSKYEMLISY